MAYKFNVFTGNFDLVEGGVSYDQDLNTTDDVTFNSVTSTTYVKVDSTLDLKNLSGVVSNLIGYGRVFTKTDGELYYKNSGEYKVLTEDAILTDLSDVVITSPTDDAILQYDTDSSSWIDVGFSTFEGTFSHDNLIAGTIASHDTTATGTELDTLTDGSSADVLHTHDILAGTTVTGATTIGKILIGTGIGTANWQAQAGDSEKVKVDASATSDYIGATSSDGVLRTGGKLSYTDGGNFVTLDVDLTANYSWTGNHDWTSDLNTTGTYISSDATSALSIADNSFAFNLAGDTDSGMFFNNASVRIELRFGNANVFEFYMATATKEGAFYMKPRASAPTGSAAKKGTLWVATTGDLYIHNGTTWVKVGSQ
jgi:hypothetical protein